MTIFYAAPSVLDQRTWLSKAIIKRGFTFWAEKFLHPPQANTSASAEKMSFDILQMQSIKGRTQFWCH